MGFLLRVLVVLSALLLLSITWFRVGAAGAISPISAAATQALPLPGNLVPTDTYSLYLPLIKRNYRECQQDVPSPDAIAVASVVDPYAKAFGVTSGQVEVVQKCYRDKDGEPFVALVSPNTTLGDIPLLIAFQNDGTWAWEEATLKLLGTKRGMLMGSFQGGNNMGPGDFTRILSVHEREFNLAGIFQGMNDIEPAENVYSQQSLGIVNWCIKEAAKNGEMILFHPLIWFSSSPDWIKSKTGDQLTNSIRNYIARMGTEITAAGPRGKPIVIVVNEARQQGDFYANKLGLDYVDAAFQAARASLPSATLVYNDYWNHTLDGARYQNTKEIVDRLKAKGLIDGVGLQMGLDGANPLRKEDVIQGMRSFGLPVYVTEFTVNMRNVGGTTAQRNELQAAIYRDMMAAAIESGVVEAFVDFQLGDKFSVWENDPTLPFYSKQADPTPYDDNLEPKPALFAQRSALLTARRP